MSSGFIAGQSREGVEAKEFACTSPVSSLVLAEIVYAHLEPVTSKPPARLRNISETHPSCQGQDSNENIRSINAIYSV